MTTAPQRWELAPPQLTLTANDVHLWRVRLDIASPLLQHLYPLLNGAEQDRAERFRFERDRRRFIGARAHLRQILSRYLTRNAQDICFVYSPHGKPALSFEQNEGDLRFNLSHSKDWAIYAIAQHREIGVDIEAVRSELDWQNLVERVFSEAEKAFIRQAPQSTRHQLFFQGWTRKEAVLKAMGCGLSCSPECIEVASATVPSTYSVQEPWGVKGHCDWSIYDIKIASDYAGALALEQHRPGLQFSHYKVSPLHL